ncbi:MAG: N-acetyl-gamma-glutamyl-phosphate reductase [Nanoarchaeota archaeon]
MIRIGIIGASGITGYELTKILGKHNDVQIKLLNSASCEGKKVKDVFPDMEGNVRDETYHNLSDVKINGLGIDVVFLCVPHTKAMSLVPWLKSKVIDLSADYRFKDPEEFEKVYNVEHVDKKTKAVYGLPELFKEKIKKARVVANPGCYATSCILAAYPIQKNAKYIVYDCKSGYSGAGKNSKYMKDPDVIKDNIEAYKLTKHRHKYEVNQFIKTKISFTPHVIDTYQGIMCTAHILLKKHQDPEEIKNLYKTFYHDKPFVKVVDNIPDLHTVQKTNMCYIGGFEVDENNQLVIVAVLDNLIKGAVGQAVQNMNIMFNIDETEGLKCP